MTSVISEIEDLKKQLIQLYQQNSYDEAINISRRLLDVSKKKYGENSEEYAINMGIMASLHRKVGNYTKAEDEIKKVLKIRSSLQGGENKHDYALNLNNLAVLYQDIGDYAKSEEYYQKALAICERSKDSQHPEIPLNDLLVVSLSNLALLHQDKGDYAKAEEYYNRILEFRAKVQGKDKHPDYARTLSNLGEMYRKMGRFVTAEILFEEAGKYYAAVNDPDYALNLNNLAVLYQQKGDYLKAEENYKRALLICEKVLSKEHRRFATILDNLAALYREEGDYGKAEENIKKALEIRKDVLGTKHPDYATSLSNLAVLYREKGDYDKAMDLFSKVLKIREAHGEYQHPDYVYTLSNLAIVYAATGRKVEAFRFLKLAMTTEHKSLERIFPMSSESVRIAFSKTIPTFYSLLSLVFHYFPNSRQEVNDAFELVLKHKAIWDYLSATKMKKLSDWSSVPIEEKIQLQKLRKQVLVNILQLSTQEEKTGDKLYELILEKERLEARLTSGVSTLGLGKNLQNVSLRSINQALPNKTALVEFVKTDLFDFTANRSNKEPQWKQPRYLAFVLTKEERDPNVKLIDIGEAAVIDANIKLFRSSISSNTPIADIRGAGDITSQRAGRVESVLMTIFEPLVPSLERHENLIVAPEGELTKIPFEIIPIGTSGDYSIDRFLISYVNTGADILLNGVSRITLQNATSGEPLVAASPNFDSVLGRVKPFDQGVCEEEVQLHKLKDGTLHFDPIPELEIEANIIAQLLKVKPLLGDNIVRSKFIFSQSPKIMHLALPPFFLSMDYLDQNKDQLKIRDTTHTMKQVSWIRIMNPMMCCGLALSGANIFTVDDDNIEETDYGLITGEDISEMNLSETDLAVLSSSDIGLQPTYAKEGLFDLGRAFKHAGVQTLVMGLWSSPNEPRIELLVDFYRRILDGHSKTESLRKAKLTLRNKYPDILNWGNLICFGNPGIQL